MNWEQLRQPSLSIKGTMGLCLVYAREVFGVKNVYQTAWLAWTATQYKHRDRNFPPVAVPCWFSWYGHVGGSYGNWGHVVVAVPGKGFYSSPIHSGKTNEIFSSIEAVEKALGAKFQGWSEDINNVRVVALKEEPMATRQEIIYAFQLGIHRNPTEKEITERLGYPVSAINVELLKGAEWLSQNHILTVEQFASFEDAVDMSQTVLLRSIPMGREEWNKYHAPAKRTFRQLYRDWAGSQEAKDARFKVWDYDRLAKEKAGTLNRDTVLEYVTKNLK